jgi:hypothetical protein
MESSQTSSVQSQHNSLDPDLPDAHGDDKYIGAALHGIGLGIAGLNLFMLIG